MHVPNLADVVVRARDRQLLRGQNRRRLIPRPRKVVAVIIQRVVRILRSIEPAQLAIAQPLIHPPDHLPRHPRTLRLHKRLERMHIVLQQLAVVIRHLLEVRHHPPLIHRYR